MIPIRITNPLMIFYLKSYENHSADFLNYENFLRRHIEVKRMSVSLCVSIFSKTRDFVVLMCVVCHFSLTRHFEFEHLFIQYIVDRLCSIACQSFANKAFRIKFDARKGPFETLAELRELEIGNSLKKNGK